MKNFLRVTSIAMVFALLIQIAPMNLIAQAVAATDTQISSDLTNNPIVKECTELRDKYTKVFERKDGSKIAVISPEAINYEKNGKMVDINNTMVESGKLFNKVLTNKDNPLGVELPKTLNEDKDIKVTNEGYTLSFKFLENLDSASAHVKKQDTSASVEVKDVSTDAFEKANLDDKSSDITYTNVMDNVDVEYVVQAEKLKENIILKEKPTEDVVFSYSLNAQGLTAKVNKDNSIDFYAGNNKKNVIFNLPAPVMFDNNNISSGDINVVLNKETDGTYTMTYVPSMTWLNGAEINYPVTIDPVVTTAGVTDSVDDTYISSSAQSMNYGTATDLHVSGGSEITLLKLNSISIPSDAVITKANVYLYNTTNVTGQQTVDVHEVTQDYWTESSLTWSNYNASYEGNIADSNIVNLAVSSYVSWDITKLMKDWCANDTMSNGIVFKTNGTADIQFASSENTASEKNPYFTVEFRNVSGISYGNDNHEQNIGRAGTAYVNDFTGALSIERTDMSFGGKDMPADITWYYNSNESGNFSYYGDGVRNKYTETLVDYGDYYTLKLGDGGERYYDVLTPAELPAIVGPNTPNVKDEQTGKLYLIKEFTAGQDSGYSVTDGETTIKYYSSDNFTYMYTYLSRIETLQSERLTHVPADAGDPNATVPVPAVTEHFAVRFDDGVDRQLDIITHSNSVYTVKDENTNMQYTIEPITDSQYSGTRFLDGNYSGYKLTDSEGNIKQYISSGNNADSTKFLFENGSGQTGTEIENDKIIIRYDFNEIQWTGKILDITDGTGRKFVFNYSGAIAMLSSVDYLGTGTTVLKKVNYTYDSNERLHTITILHNLNETGKQVKYEWDTNGNILTVSNTDGGAMAYTFSTGATRQVTLIQELANNTNHTAGNNIGITYGVNQTTFTDNAGNIQAESFDQYGNTVSTQDKDGNATFGAYGGDSGKGRNLLIGKSNPRRPTVNLMNNGGFENSSENSPIALQDPVTGVSETPSFIGTTSEPAYAGDRCYKVSCGASLSGNVAGTVLQLTEGKLYSVSFWIRTVGTGATAHIIWNDNEVNSDICPNIKTDGKWQYVQEHVLTATEQATITIDVENSSSENSADFYIDNIQFEHAIPANPFNFVENSNFSESGNPHWTIPSAASVGSYPEGYTGVPSKLLGGRLAVTGSTSDSITTVQSININGKSGGTYTFGGWASALNALPNSDTVGNRSFSITIVKPANNQDPAEELGRIEYNTYISSWQFQESSFTLAEDCPSIELRLNYNDQSGTAYFDGIEFFKDALYMDFNSSGDIVNNAETTSTSADTGNENNSGVTSGNEYDKYGNTIKSYSTNGQVKIQQTNTYSTDGSNLTSSTNELGSTTQYTNNEQLGLVSSIEDAKSNIISYAYNSLMQNTGVSQTVTNPYGATTTLNLSSTFTYNDSDNVSEISNANGTIYDFTYDIWGNPLTVSVGDVHLATYTYSNDAERRLTQITYANGNELVFTKYTDENGTKMDLTGYSDGVNVSYFLGVYYNDFGEPAVLTDCNGTFYKERNGVMIEYAYNLEPNEAYKVVHSYGQTQITNGTEFLEKIDSTSIKSTYTNDDKGNPAFATFKIAGSTTDSVNQEKRYDEFNRLIATGAYQGTSNSPPENAAMWSTYSYTDLPGFRTTNQIAGMNISGGTGANTFSKDYHYNYDATGNITDIYKNGALLVHYEYDGAGQLIRENNAQQNKTFTYEYNSGGNIILKSEFDYTTAALDQETPVDTTPYAYGDSNWPDKLTSYDGSAAFEYDASGNPKDALGSHLEWDGRGQLKSLTNSETAVSYSYDFNGIRKSKTVTYTGNSGVTTNYTVVDGRITCQQTGNNKIYFFYDESGQLVSLNYEGADYFYVKNLQGDIVGITNVDGKLLVEYTYDTWGNLLSTDSSAQNNIANDNPFLYRCYYLDRETDLYYLQSRYYSPVLDRFINADGIDQVNGSNLFVYCDNNPVNKFDQNGKSSSILSELNELYTKHGIFGFVSWNNSITEWTSTLEPPQALLGYGQIYDDSAPMIGIYINCLKSEFAYGKYDWLVELWKGRYGITLGGEIGVYNKPSSSKSLLYSCAIWDNKLFQMGFVIYALSGSGKTLSASVLMTRYSDAHWWLTGFHIGLDSLDISGGLKPTNLVMCAIIDFKTKTMANLFCKHITVDSSEVYAASSFESTKVFIVWGNKKYFV